MPRLQAGGTLMYAIFNEIWPVSSIEMCGNFVRTLGLQNLSPYSYQPSTAFQSTQPVHDHHSLHYCHPLSESHPIPTSRLYRHVPHTQHINIALQCQSCHLSIEIPDFLVSFSSFDFDVACCSWTDPEHGGVPLCVICEIER